MKDNRYLVTGCGDGELRVWNLSEKTEKEENENLTFTVSPLDEDGAEDTMVGSCFIITS